MCVCGVECVCVFARLYLAWSDCTIHDKSSSLFKFHRRPNPSLCVIAYLILVRIISNEE